MNKLTYPHDVNPTSAWARWMRDGFVCTESDIELAADLYAFGRAMRGERERVTGTPRERSMRDAFVAGARKRTESALAAKEAE